MTDTEVSTKEWTPLFYSDIIAVVMGNKTVKPRQISRELAISPLWGCSARNGLYAREVRTASRQSATTLCAILILCQLHNSKVNSTRHKSKILMRLAVSILPYPYTNSYAKLPIKKYLIMSSWGIAH